MFESSGRDGDRVARPGWRSLAVVAMTLAWLPPALAAQTLRGSVFEGDTTNPVVGATIEVLRADSTRVQTVTSDEQGRFELELATAGRYLLRPSHPSYMATGLESVDVGAHEIVSVVLRMGATAIPLERLVVTARSSGRLAGFYSRAERNRLAYFIKREDIERRRAGLASQLVQVAPGVRLVRSAEGTNDVITMRGITGPCAAFVLLDGLPLAQDVGVSIDEVTTPELLEGVEIYPPNTALPQEFPIHSNDCGVVAFWSRRSAFRPITWTRVIVGAAIGALILLGSRLL